MAHFAEKDGVMQDKQYRSPEHMPPDTQGLPGPHMPNVAPVGAALPRQRMVESGDYMVATAIKPRQAKSRRVPHGRETLPTNEVRRERVSSRLSQALRAPLTVVAAPAGSGKT